MFCMKLEMWFTVIYNCTRIGKQKHLQAAVELCVSLVSCLLVQICFSSFQRGSNSMKN